MFQFNLFNILIILYFLLRKNLKMFFNSYVMTKHQKEISDIFYQKIVNVSRNKVFYTKLNIPDTLDGRYDLLALFSINIFHYQDQGQKVLNCHKFYLTKFF